MRAIVFSAILSAVAALPARAEPLTFKEASAVSCRSYVAEWNTTTGKDHTFAIVAYIYKNAGDAGANLGNSCNVSEYVAVICGEKGASTVGRAVAELLRREAKGVEPPAPKATCAADR